MRVRICLYLSGRLWVGACLHVSARVGASVPRRLHVPLVALQGTKLPFGACCRRR